jgi:hypothetical protein
VGDSKRLPQAFIEHHILDIVPNEILTSIVGRHVQPASRICITSKAKAFFEIREIGGVVLPVTEHSLPKIVHCGNEFCLSFLSLGTVGTLYPHHHTFVQLSKDNPDILLQHSSPAPGKGGNNTEKEVEAIPGSCIPAIVPSVSGIGVRATVPPGRRTTQCRQQQDHLPGQYLQHDASG